jgi:endonuclease YncB( thermonuclease family)
LDGDKLVIRSGGKPWEVLLIGLDAPEEDEGPAGECFADEAADRLVELAPRGATVYLEKGGDEVDDKDRLLRFLWVEDGGQALLANETLLREGFGSFDPREQNGAYDDELRAAEAAARDDGVGLWGECGENHVELPEEERAEVASAPEPDRDADGDGIAAADEQAESESSTESDSVAATEEEQAYVDSFIEQSSDLSDSLGRFSELALDPKIGDQDWTIGIAVELAVWRSTYQEAQALPVPPAFTEIHAAYLEALSYLDSASYDIVTGLDTFDPQLLAQANANIVLGNERITEVRRLVDELREERGL